jgi:PEP-CTERM motif
MRVRLLTLAASLSALCSLASAATPVSSHVNVPEPSILAMAGVGVVGLAGAVWRKVRK